MSIIYSYPHAVPTITDTLIGTKYVENQEPATKSFSIGDIVDLVPIVSPTYTYKVFTALLTQSGGSNLVYIDNVPLAIGVTYLISHNQFGTADFTNVGAPNNEIGTPFVATGTTPNSWGTGTVDLRYDEGAPVVTVLENTIGNIWFEYDDIGVYLANLTGAFTINKTFITLTLGSGALCILNSQRGTDDYVLINANNVAAPNNAIDVNGVMQIEIRVYN